MRDWKTSLRSTTNIEIYFCDPTLALARSSNADTNLLRPCIISQGHRPLRSTLPRTRLGRRELNNRPRKPYNSRNRSQSGLSSCSNKRANPPSSGNAVVTLGVPSAWELRPVL
jgi:IS30 family transposase